MTALIDPPSDCPQPADHGPSVCRWPSCRCYIPSQPAALNMPDDKWARRNCPDEMSYRDLIASGGIRD
jgi:hypothetical protein